MNEISNAEADADAGAASPVVDATGEVAGGGYAQLILPTLQRIRAARQQADALLADAATRPAVAACAESTRATIVAFDQRLRAAGIYDLTQAGLLDQDAQRMAQACRLIDATHRQLRQLAHELRQRAEHCAVAGDAALAGLIATLDALR